MVDIPHVFTLSIHVETSLFALNQTEETPPSCIHVKRKWRGLTPHLP